MLAIIVLVSYLWINTHLPDENNDPLPIKVSPPHALYPFLPFKNCIINHHLFFLHYQSFPLSESFPSAFTRVLVSSIKKKNPHLTSHFFACHHIFMLFFIAKHFQCCLHMLCTFSHLSLTLQLMTIWICPVTPLKWLSRLPITFHIAKAHRHNPLLDLSVAFDIAHHLLFS